MCCRHLKEVNPSFTHFTGSELRLEVGIAHHALACLLRNRGLGSARLLAHLQRLLGFSTTMEADIPCPFYRADDFIAENTGGNSCELEAALVIVTETLDRWHTELLTRVLHILRKGIVESGDFTLSVAVLLQRPGVL